VAGQGKSAGQRRTIRCAIYTRKSSEEGLEQSFNSLDAQRESCQAYILSQKQEGWRAVDFHYDDGGYSGGSMERPGLKRLLADIDAKKVDAVVVYKVDRLTRSLADFAKIIEAFDARGVSFVSVTQQFNTTSSMGRLTLNVLLSFAQFEREVTGERIRDKIAASKRKGMWMGGRVPLGYDLKDRRLLINKGEAEQVREIFRLYLEFGCVRKLKAHLDRGGIRSKVRISRTGKRSGGAAYSRGALYKILNNRIYLGEIPHKENSYTGEHAAIIDPELWQRVHAKLAENAYARRHGTNASAPSLLRGLLYDEDGNRFTPSHAVKSGKRYSYYVSQRVTKSEAGSAIEPNRIPAREIEDLIIARLRNFFGSPNQVVGLLACDGDDVATTQDLVQAAAHFAQELNAHSAAQVNEMLTAIMFRATVLRESVRLECDKHAIRARLLAASEAGEADLEADNEHDVFTLEIPARLKRCGGEMRLIIPGSAANDQRRQPVPSLVKAVSRAHEWIRRIESGEFKDQRAIAAPSGLDERYVSHILPSAFLAPEIVEAILEGRHASDLTLDTLLKDVPLSWAEQRRRRLNSPHQ
jgi:site-specific DNA recombinase